jgi:hypothetical protein
MVANAAWWGFAPADSTAALQAAINSGAAQVIVPNMGKDWIVRPIRLVSNQELVLQQGVVITAKRGEYRGLQDSVFTAADVSNLTISGYGATIRMNKDDYIVGKVLLDYGWHRWFGQYEKGEWRMALWLGGCTNVKVYGLTLRDSGGDGIYVAGGATQAYCKDIYLKDVVCDNNYRQGISVISADGLVVEGCVFQRTWGTPPCAGVDLEPDVATEMLRNIVFRNCLFKDNYGDGIEVFLSNLTADSGDVSILFDNCFVTTTRGSGIRVTHDRDTGPGGLIEFRNCVVDGAEGYGIRVKDKSADRARVRFVNCTVRKAANNANYAAPWTPMWLNVGDSTITAKFGGIDFVDCFVEDDYDRPVVIAEGDAIGLGIFDITGTISVTNPYGVKYDLPPNQTGVTLVIQANPQTSGILRGQVKAAASGAPLVGATVRAYLGGVLRGTATTIAPNGMYEMSVNLATGTYTVSATRAGYMTQTKTGIPVTAGATTPLAFNLQASGVLRGQVKDKVSGAPLVGATVNAYLGGVLRGTATTTAPNGMYEINTNLPAGTYIMSGGNAGYLTQTKTGMAVTAGATTLCSFNLQPR